MTVSKTDEDLNPRVTAKKGPELINTEATDPQVKALLARYPKAKNIERLPSGSFAVRFLKKRNVYIKPRSHG
ncbi:hypothetical protein SAMN02745126_04000 [Enhydrobacter aerosaccus]|uniref:Uncharacterized protein n=1 Tax=Enhydrobacter aerosaccus TaxID=225324 RepID=A0A1T4RNW5_9HYPH|nr:hypothetical protein [Enhydrobacter aerosaccus]SKA17690.1 hypothetical protein SAMN02745126_04000 [Enhydrobacter aerosaccus]